MEIGKTFCGRTDVRTDGRTHLSSNLLGHRRGDDLIKIKVWSRYIIKVPLRQLGVLLSPPCVADADNIFSSCGLFLLSSFFLSFFSSPNLSRRRLNVYHSWTHGGLSANLGCRSEACWKYRTQKIAKNSPFAHHRTTLSGYILATKARIDRRKKTC